MIHTTADRVAGPNFLRTFTGCLIRCPLTGRPAEHLRGPPCHFNFKRDPLVPEVETAACGLATASLRAAERQRVVGSAAANLDFSSFAENVYIISDVHQKNPGNSPEGFPAPQKNLD